MVPLHWPAEVLDHREHVVLQENVEFFRLECPDQLVKELISSRPCLFFCASVLSQTYGPLWQVVQVLPIVLIKQLMLPTETQELFIAV